MFTICVWVSPSSDVQLNASTPLSVAIVENAMKGLAEIAGKRSALKTSAPF
jgi:hypothetical protein